MNSKFKSYDSEFTKVDVILEKSIAIDVQASTIKANQQEIKSKAAASDDDKDLLAFLRQSHKKTRFLFFWEQKIECSVHF